MLLTFFKDIDIQFQIGNAVPPPLAFNIGQKFVESLVERKREEQEQT